MYQIGAVQQPQNEYQGLSVVARPSSSAGSIGGYESDASGQSFWGAHSDVDPTHSRAQSMSNIAGYLSPSALSPVRAPGSPNTSITNFLGSATLVGEPALVGSADPFLVDSQPVMDHPSLGAFGLGFGSGSMSVVSPQTPTVNITYYPAGDGRTRSGTEKTSVDLALENLALEALALEEQHRLRGQR
ncbi:hypothetical protein M427DRAFT_385277 [Gonapodya prolifera JEL478]|uniref:Uncharacterized protein n=1 Tax=Gonapodya prolifera (strain JEL478) TaxID=1344416 RepID=A0A139A8S2_GONPJ|nr:hypothetical protein M427DRAFT_385277 [Gonapodya prolifera JEL478]|eukprot:KXS13078.1 hypothetical protein M427DRAFT_385277 [Gonapodya prolifera JEL478]